MASTTSLLVSLSFLAGAVHVLAPDHWVPSSVFTWQRAWRLRHTALFAVVLLLAHVFAGLLIYFLFRNVLSGFSNSGLLIFAVSWVGGFTLLRIYRFSRVREVLRAGPNSLWAAFAVFSILGPSESLIPILMKSKSMGMGYGSALGAYLLGTLVTGTAAIVLARMAWERPAWLPRIIHWAYQRTAVVPFAAGLVMSLSVLLRIA